MHSLAPIMTPGAQALPTQWVATSPAGPVISSPAATTATAWVPQPAAYVPQQQVTMLDALASALLAGAGQAGVASVMSSPIAAPQAVAPAPMVAAPPTMAPIAVPVHVPAPSTQQQTQTLPAVAAASTEVAPATEDATSTPAAASKARRSGTERWAGVRNPRSIHISQVPSKYNPSPAAGNKDCGPASVVMTLRLLGTKIPGVAAGASPQRLINAVRSLAGNTANSAATTNHELARALRAAGTETREISDLASIKAAVRSGKPVILNGNPRHKGAYGHAFSAKQMTPYDGAHWIVVSGYDSKSGKFIINDPLSKVGPVKVTAAQLEAYRGGSLGIEVTA